MTRSFDSEIGGACAFLALMLDACSEEAGGCGNCPVSGDCVAMWDWWTEGNPGFSWGHIRRQTAAIEEMRLRRRSAEAVIREATVAVQEAESNYPEIARNQPLPAST
ncbi:MAG: hypothetical protein M0R22_07325 [Dehalococcoidia bacterium]|jgi:hypothetical protein|nr:hypothetical protein [Dehalococcoidia bacterium]